MKIVRFLYAKKIGWGKYDSLSQKIYTSVHATEKLKRFQDVIEYFSKAERGKHSYTDVIHISDVKLLAPALPSKNILCIGKNYYDHIVEFDGSDHDIKNVKEKPIFFSKAISSITGPNSPILLHEEITNSVDYEAELAVIIGKRGVNILKENAFQHVYGYTILNDVTARDLQKEHQQWLRGKSLDTHCPIGPWIVTSNEIKDPQNLGIKSIVNGEIRQDGNTIQMLHDVASLIAELSKGMTLEAGDIIATGTPRGVGMGFDPPKFLQNGDKVEIEIEKIGSLVNSVESMRERD